MAMPRSYEHFEPVTLGSDKVWPIAIPSAESTAAMFPPPKDSDTWVGITYPDGSALELTIGEVKALKEMLGECMADKEREEEDDPESAEVCRRIKENLGIEPDKPKKL